MTAEMIPQAVELPGEAVVTPREKWVSTAIGKMAVGATLFAEITPLNEALRVGATVAAYHAGGPEAAAATLAATTFVIEGAAGMVVSDALETESGRSLVGRVHDKLGKARDYLRTNALGDLGIAATVGTAAAVVSKQIQDPERTSKQNRSFSMKSAAILAGINAPAGYLLAEGVHYQSPVVLGLGALAAGAAVGGARMFRRSHGDTKPDATVENKHAERAVPRYDLSKEELDVLEADIVERAKTAKGMGLRGLTAVWIPSNDPHANFLRTHEKDIFSEDHIDELFAEHEDSSMFMALVDTRHGQNRVVRGMRFSTPRLSEDGGATNMAMIQDMVKSGQITEEQFSKYYEDRGINVDDSVSMETHFRIGGRAPRAFGAIPTASLGYLTAYNYATKHNRKASDVALFAHINKASIDSFERIGLGFEPLMGDKTLQTPSAASGKMDPNFMPVAIANDKNTARIMRRLAPFAPREVSF